MTATVAESRVTPSRRAFGLASLGVACFVAFALLGRAATAGAAISFDAAFATALFGRLPGAAWAFTQTGYAPFLVAASVCAFFAVRALGGPFWLALVTIASQLISQAVVAALKDAFGRPRPAQYIGVHELGLSYPSGHATTAVVFYTFWAIVLWRSRAPGGVRVAGCIALCAWALAIDLSRIVLGAHHASDVVGGTLFGAGWLAIGFAIVASRERSIHAR